MNCSIDILKLSCDPGTRVRLFPEFDFVLRLNAFYLAVDYGLYNVTSLQSMSESRGRGKGVSGIMKSKRCRSNNGRMNFQCKTAKETKRV